MISRGDITLGILAGGRAVRLGGLDKAWIERGGVPQVMRWHQRFAGEVATTLVSANRAFSRYQEAGLEAVADRAPTDHGPIGGLDALLMRCRTPWLFTLPVDLVGVNECLLATLIAQRGDNGAFAQDDDGVQPLVALWRVAPSRDAVALAIQQPATSVQHLQATLQMARVCFQGVRFGNLNTPDDLRVAGFATATGAADSCHE